MKKILQSAIYLVAALRFCTTHAGEGKVECRRLGARRKAFIAARSPVGADPWRRGMAVGIRPKTRAGWRGEAASSPAIRGHTYAGMTAKFSEE